MEEEKELNDSQPIEPTTEPTVEPSVNDQIISEPVLEQTELPLEQPHPVEQPVEIVENEPIAIEQEVTPEVSAEEPVEAEVVEIETEPVVVEEVSQETDQPEPVTESEISEPKRFEEPKEAVKNTAKDKKILVSRIIAIVVVLLVIIAAVFFFSKKSVSTYEENPDIKISVDGRQEQGKVSIIEETRSDIKLAIDNNEKVVWPKTKVIAYFGNTQKNPNSADCSLTYPLDREIEKKYDSNMLNSVLALLEPLTNSEKEAGFVSMIPEGSFLKNIKVDDSGVATASFNGNISTAAGSCAITAIKSQIKDTLLQFASIKSVVICINDNCKEDEILQP